MLDKEFTKVEIREALFQMYPNKAPRPHGMTTCFYQRYWELLGGDITKACLQVLNGNASLSSVNKTNIMLIPKVRSPS